MQAPRFILHCPHSVCKVSSFQVNHLKDILPSALRFEYDTVALTLRVPRINYKKRRDTCPLQLYPLTCNLFLIQLSLQDYSKQIPSSSVSTHPWFTVLQRSSSFKWPWKHHMLTVTGHLFWGSVGFKVLHELSPQNPVPNDRNTKLLAAVLPFLTQKWQAWIFFKK